jgi:hypothetical protein
MKRHAVTMVPALLTASATSLLDAEKAAFASILQWIAHVGMPTSRVLYTAVVLVTVQFTWSLNERNLLGWKL